MASKLNLLFISYFTAPCGDVSAIRITKFIKYLLKKGHSITLLTVQEKYYTNKNENWLSEIDGATIIRTEQSNFNIPFLTEEGFFWYSHLNKQLKSTLSTNKFDLVFYNGSPFYHWLTSYTVKKMCTSPIVFDFRDPWYLFPYRNQSSIKTKFAGFFERRIIKNADLILNVTKDASDLYKNEYPDLAPICQTIANGYDPEDFEHVQERSQTSKFDIIYAGKFGFFRDITPFLQGFKKFIKHHSLSPEDTRFIWVGEPEDHIIEQVKNEELEDFVSYKGFQPYNDTLSLLKSSSLCLLIAGNHSYEPTTKIFDYLALNKPTLAVINTPGFISDTLQDIETSSVVYQNPEDIFQAITKHYLSKDDISKNLNFNTYNRKNQTDQLEALFLALVK